MQAFEPEDLTAIDTNMIDDLRDEFNGKLEDLRDQLM